MVTGGSVTGVVTVMVGGVNIIGLLRGCVAVCDGSVICTVAETGVPDAFPIAGLIAFPFGLFTTESVVLLVVENVV
jgi:hypothetical protein